MLSKMLKEIYKRVYQLQWNIMGSRKRRTVKPQRKTRSVEGRCPKCTTIVRFNVSGPVGDEIYECKGCMSKYHIDEL